MPNPSFASVSEERIWSLLPSNIKKTQSWHTDYVTGSGASITFNPVVATTGKDVIYAANLSSVDNIELDWEQIGPAIKAGTAGAEQSYEDCADWFAANIPTKSVWSYKVPWPSENLDVNDDPFTYILQNDDVTAFTGLEDFFDAINIDAYEHHPHALTQSLPLGQRYDWEARLENDITKAKSFGVPVTVTVWAHNHDTPGTYGGESYSYKFMTDADWEEMLRWILDRIDPDDGDGISWWGSETYYLTQPTTYAIMLEAAGDAGYLEEDYASEASMVAAYCDDELAAKLAIFLAVVDEYSRTESLTVPYHLDAAMLFTPGAATGKLFTPGAVTGQLFTPGPAAGRLVRY